MEPPLYMRSIIEQNIVMWHITVNVCNAVNKILFYIIKNVKDHAQNSIQSATCQFAGFSKEPQGVSCKMVFITGYMASYLLYTWFAAGVTSLLAVQGQDTHLQLSDVVQMGSDFSAFWDGLLPDFFMVRNLH